MTSIYRGSGASLEEAKSAPTTAFTWKTEPQPHAARRRALQKAHPELDELMGPRPISAIYIAGAVLLQVVAAGLIVHYAAPWWAIGLAAFGFGAIVDHMLWVLIHDLTHDNVFPSSTLNNLFICISNLPIIFPAGITFKYYHQQHHARMNEAYDDPDLPSKLEDRLFGHWTLGKVIWLMGFAIWQSVRVLRYKPGLGGLEKWAAVNWGMQLTFVAAVWYVLGPAALGYLIASSLFSVGLHPLGARWIAEHYNVADQETFSYYGTGNFFNLNVGYHNEHHDLPSVPWMNLPKLKAMAPEFYDTLWHHTSYWRLLMDFIFNPNFTLESRVARQNTKKTPGYLRNDSLNADGSPKAEAAAPKSSEGKKSK